MDFSTFQSDMTVVRTPTEPDTTPGPEAAAE